MVLEMLIVAPRHRISNFSQEPLTLQDNYQGPLSSNSNYNNSSNSNSNSNNSLTSRSSPLPCKHSTTQVASQAATQLATKLASIVLVALWKKQTLPPPSKYLMACHNIISTRRRLSSRLWECLLDRNFPGPLPSFLSI